MSEANEMKYGFEVPLAYIMDSAFGAGQYPEGGMTTKGCLINELEYNSEGFITALEENLGIPATEEAEQAYYDINLDEWEKIVEVDNGYILTDIDGGNSPTVSIEVNITVDMEVFKEVCKEHGFDITTLFMNTVFDKGIDEIANMIGKEGLEATIHACRYDNGELVYAVKMLNDNGVDYDTYDVDMAECIGECVFHFFAEDKALTDLAEIHRKASMLSVALSVQSVLKAVGKDYVAKDLEEGNYMNYIKEEPKKEKNGSFLHRLAEKIDRLGSVLDEVEEGIDKGVEKLVSTIAGNILAVINDTAEKNYAKMGMPLDMSAFNELPKAEQKGFLNQVKIYKHICKAGTEEEKDMLYRHLQQYGVLKEEMQIIGKDNVTNTPNKANKNIVKE